MCFKKKKKKETEASHTTEFLHCQDFSSCLSNNKSKNILHLIAYFKNSKPQEFSTKEKKLKHNVLHVTFEKDDCLRKKSLVEELILSFSHICFLTSLISILLMFQILSLLLCPN